MNVSLANATTDINNRWLWARADIDCERLYETDRTLFSRTQSRFLLTDAAGNCVSPRDTPLRISLACRHMCFKRGDFP